MRAIDADVFKHHLENCICELKDTNQITDDYETILKALNNQPTIEPECGEWIDEGYYTTTAYGTLYSYTCSNCNADVIIEDYDSFCPNCGADMRGYKRPEKL